MKTAFIMDPLERVKAYKDTTYYLMLAARERGHEVFYLDQRMISVKEGRVFGELIPTHVHAADTHPFSTEPARVLPLDAMDMVWIRTDPPFDRTYFYTTLLLDLLPSSTRVINRPAGLRNWNEKLAALFFQALTPPTLVSSRETEIKAFMKERGKITLKPIDGHGGRGILFLEPGMANLDTLIQMSTHYGRHRVIAQTYVPEALAGDKRILLLNGEPLGGILRLHPEGKELNNLDAGGTAHAYELTARDRETCRALGQGLVREGIVFCGIDILGDALIEINVTSPTGLRELCRFSRTDYHHRIIEALE